MVQNDGNCSFESAAESSVPVAGVIRTGFRYLPGLPGFPQLVGAALSPVPWALPLCIIRPT